MQKWKIRVRRWDGPQNIFVESLIEQDNYPEYCPHETEKLWSLYVYPELSEVVVAVVPMEEKQ